MKVATKAFLVTGIFLTTSTYAFAGVTLIPIRHIANATWVIPADMCKIQPMALEKGAMLYGNYEVNGRVDERLSVELLDERNFRRWRARRPYRHFSAMSRIISGAARLRFTAPHNGRYYALFCNYKALFLDRQVTVNLYTTYSNLTAADIAFRRRIEKLTFALHKIFRVPDFDVTVRPCGMKNAFSTPDITICTEMFNALPANIAPAIFLSVFFHEFAHTALHLWNLPGASNEDTADEFSAVILLVTKHRRAIAITANWQLSKRGRTWSQVRRKILVGDRHSLSIQRARNLRRWAHDDGELIRQWATLLAPHFTDSVLKSMAHNPKFERNAAIQREYMRRFGN